MSLVRENHGCKVGWARYDDENEARERGSREELRAVERAEAGYDFGYSVPGQVTDASDGMWLVVTA